MPPAATLDPVRTKDRRAVMLYDGLCPFCCKGVAIVRRLDWFNLIHYVDARHPEDFPLPGVQLEPKRLLEEMHVVTGHGLRVYHGFAALRWLAWRLPLLWGFAPLFYLPGVLPVGQWLYLWVARNRFRLIPCHGGVCTLPGHTMKHGGQPAKEPAPPSTP
jgi:predicted DCC family thiol-disulfide oxidoreductase YuxK